MEPVFKDGQFVPRLMLPLSLSYDHRAIDGADGARFLRWVAEVFEQPFLLSLAGMICRPGRRRRRRPGRLRRRVSRRRSRPQDRARRSRSQPRRRLRLSRLHPVEGAAARREARRRSAPRRRLGHHVRRADDRSRQAARVQGQRRQAADERHRACWPRAGRCSTSRASRRARRRAHAAREARRRAAKRRSSSSTRSSPPARCRPCRRRSTPGDDDPRVMDSTAALDLPDIPKIAARRRRRLHRPRARLGLRGARQRRHRRRDDGRPAARRRPRSRRRPGQAAQADDEDGAAEDAGRRR